MEGEHVPAEHPQEAVYHEEHQPDQQAQYEAGQHPEQEAYQQQYEEAPGQPEAHLPTPSNASDSPAPGPQVSASTAAPARASPPPAPSSGTSSPAPGPANHSPAANSSHASPVEKPQPVASSGAQARAPAMDSLTVRRYLDTTIVPVLRQVGGRRMQNLPQVQSSPRPAAKCLLGAAAVWLLAPQ